MSDPLQYAPSRGPYGDFVVVNGDSSVRLDGFYQMSVCSGLSIYTQFPDLRRTTGTIFYGVARQGRRLIFGPIILESVPPDLSGQYVLLSLHSKAISIECDRLGLVPLFYYRGADRFICSNRLHLLALALKALRETIECDYGSILASMYVDKSICMQVGTRRLPIAGARMTMANERLLATAKDLTVQEDSQPAPGRITEAEYWSLIRAGADEICANVQAALDCGYFDRYIATLTGGRDSRVILAAILALDRIREVRFHTRPIDDRDVAIATGLVKRFGGTYATTPAGITNRVDPDDKLRRHRSIFFGLYHDVKLPSVAIEEYEQCQIRFVGGCGELYRGFYQKQYPESFLDEAPSTDVLRQLLSRHRSWVLFPSDALDAVVAAYAEESALFRAKAIRGLLDRHYLNYRNRLHFGLSATGRPIEALSWQPLISPSLLKAANGLPETIKESGRVLFDVTRELCEPLAYLPYTGAKRPAFEEMPFHRASAYDHTSLELQPALSMIPRSQRGGSPVTRKAEYQHIINELIGQHFKAIQNNGGALGDLMTDKLWSRIQWLSKVNSKFYRVWFSRLAGIYDAVLTPPKA